MTRRFGWLAAAVAVTGIETIAHAVTLLPGESEAITGPGSPPVGFVFASTDEPFWGRIGTTPTISPIGDFTSTAFERSGAFMTYTYRISSTNGSIDLHQLIVGGYAGFSVDVSFLADGAIAPVQATRSPGDGDVLTIDFTPAGSPSFQNLTGTQSTDTVVIVTDARREWITSANLDLLFQNQPADVFVQGQIFAAGTVLPSVSPSAIPEPQQASTLILAGAMWWAWRKIRGLGTTR